MNKDEQKEAVFKNFEKNSEALLNKLFNLNVALAAFFVSVFTFSDHLQNNRIFLILPFLNLALITAIDFINIQMSISIFNKIDIDEKVNTDKVRDTLRFNNLLTYFAIIITIMLVIMVVITAYQA